MIKKIIALLIFVLFLSTMLKPVAAALPYAQKSSEYFDFPKDTRISMDFQSARVNTVLKMLSQQSGLNFISTDKVANRIITLYLDDVPIEEALEQILSVSGLTYEVTPGSNIFMVKPLQISDTELITRVYPLKFATVSNSKLNNTLASIQGGNADSSIKEAIKEILSSDGALTEDPRTNSLIITDVPTRFRAIERMIARLDVRIPQILIEVEMLDVSSSTADLLGAKFGNTPIEFFGAQRDGVYPFNEDNLEDDGFAFEEAQYRVSTLSFQGLSFALQFLRTQTDTRSLARPRILTLNNQTAKIKIKAEEAVAEVQKTVSSEGSSETGNEAERFETGVFLTVTPQANVQTGSIKMAIEPKVIQIRASSITVSNQKVFDPEERGTQSVLRIQNGDTIVLGGLLRTDATDIRTKVPILGNLPIIGAAFRHKDKNENERELLIFITPSIIKEDHLATAAANSKGPQPSLSREQDIPSLRQQEIDRAITLIENQRRF